MAQSKNSTGYELSLFMDQHTAAFYLCGICHKVCKEAVEIDEFMDENPKTSSASIVFEEDIGTEGLLFCHHCIAQSNLCKTWHPVEFTRNTINNLMVTCPSGINCKWNGRLSLLQHHIDHECANRQCPFGCNTQEPTSKTHLKHNQIQHINALLTMVQSLTVQVQDLQRQIDENKQAHSQEINQLKQQLAFCRTHHTPNTPNIACVSSPPPPPARAADKQTRKTRTPTLRRQKPLPPAQTKNKAMPPSAPTLQKSKSWANIKSKDTACRSTTRPMDAVASDFVFQRDHPIISVIQDGRTAICSQHKDVLIEFGECFFVHKPSHKMRARAARHRESSIDDLFGSPRFDENSSLDILDLESPRIAFHRNEINISPVKRRHVSSHKRAVSDMHYKVNNNGNGVHNWSQQDVYLDTVNCWQCFVYIEECDEKCGNIGVALLRGVDDGVCFLYKNGDFVDVNKSKRKYSEFEFNAGNTIQINLRWQRTKCCVKVLNIETSKSVTIDKLDMFTKLGFVLNKARITVIEQFWM